MEEEDETTDSVKEDINFKVNKGESSSPGGNDTEVNNTATDYQQSGDITTLLVLNLS